jgi:hypothetical protein
MNDRQSKYGGNTRHRVAAGLRKVLVLPEQRTGFGLDNMQ